MSGIMNGIDSLNCSYEQLRQNIDNLTYRDWFYVSLVRKLDKDFIRQFKDKINIQAFVHRVDLDKKFFYEMIDKKDTESLLEFIVNNQERFYDFVDDIMVQNIEMFNQEQIQEINNAKNTALKYDKDQIF